jgi:acyl carrier protein
MTDIGERVSHVVASKLHIPPDRITEAATFADDFAVTSLDMVETIMSLEEEFEIEISDREAEKLQTVGDVVSLVRRKTH